MTDDEINDLIIQNDATSGEVSDVIAFARAVAAKEREACAKIVDVEMDGWDDRNVSVALNNVAAEIRARGMK